MAKKKKLPKIPKDKVTPTIITGIEALGRGNDLNRLDIYLSGISQILGPETLNQYINMREYMTRRAAALGIDTQGLVKSEEEIQMQMQQQQMQAMAQQVAPNAADAVAQQMQQQTEQQNV